MDRRIVPVIRNPKADSERAASVLLRQILVVVTSDMNTRLVSLGLAQDCDVPRFLATAEPFLSAELKSGVGQVLFDNAPPSTYEDWLMDVRKVLRMIDEGE